MIESDSFIVVVAAYNTVTVLQKLELTHYDSEVVTWITMFLAVGVLLC